MNKEINGERKKKRARLKINKDTRAKEGFLDYRRLGYTYGQKIKE
jgi:hypothetical protein